MNAHAENQRTASTLNGIDVDQIEYVIGEVKNDRAFGQCQFRAKNKWVDGGINRSEIQDYFIGGKEDETRTESFTLRADEPPLLAGSDIAPNPVEYVLHALAACLTTTMVAHAAVRGIVINHVESQLEGDIDLRGFLGLSESVRKGYQAVRVTFKVDSEADTETLKELAMFSPVYDIVSNSLPVELVVESV